MIIAATQYSRGSYLHSSSWIQIVVMAQLQPPATNNTTAFTHPVSSAVHEELNRPAGNNNRPLPAKKQKKMKPVDVELERRRAAAATKMKELSLQQAPKTRSVRRCQVCFQESKTSKLDDVQHAQLERTGKAEPIKTFCPFADDITIWKEIVNKRTYNRKTWNKTMHARKKARKSSNNDT